jgi:hypothetical protein
MTGHEHPAPHGPGPDEIYEQDVVRPVRPVVHARVAAPSVSRGSARGLAIPGAVVATLLVTGLVFAAGGFRPSADSGPGSNAQPTIAIPVATVPAAAQPVQPTADPTAPTNVTEPPAATPATTPLAVAPIDLTARFSDNHVDLAWTTCAADGFAYWKVVRSKDVTATWPLGDGDTLLAAISKQDTLAAADRSMPRGATSWYRVFAVVDFNGELVPVCASEPQGVAVPAPTPKPTADPTAEPTPDPTPKPMNLDAKFKNGVPYLKWTACTSDRFDYYKVVRSTDKTVEWPSGDGDTLIAAISNQAETGAWDYDAPAGETSYYKVFCVDSTDAGYITLDATPVRSVKVLAVEPPPSPVDLGFSAGFDAGTVHLNWDACVSTGDFVYYKVVRSLGSNPSYLPWTDGTELIGVISNQAEVAYDDASVATGEVWHYRIQALGWWSGEKVVLCQSAVVEVVIP